MESIPASTVLVSPEQALSNLKKHRHVVITEGDEPVAVLSIASEKTLDRILAALRGTRVAIALEEVQADIQRKGIKPMTMDEIQDEMDQARMERRR